MSSTDVGRYLADRFGGDVGARLAPVVLGNARDAIVHMERGQKLSEPEREGAGVALNTSYGAGTSAWDSLAVARWLPGYPAAALTALHEGRARAERLHHP